MKLTSNKSVVPLLIAVGAYLFTLLACNAPLGQSTIPPPPTLVTAPATSATIPVQPSVITPTQTGNTVALPTFTPAGTPILNATLLGVTPAATVTVSETETDTPPASEGQLSFAYQIEWTISEQNPFIAIALVAIQAQGGNGQYSYYHDDLLQDGATFTYQWATCRGNPGSLRVDSGDGQSVRVNYFETPPCPQTPVP